MNTPAKQNQYDLYKPPVHPKIFFDETPTAYLMRLAKLNRYSLSSWLIKDYSRMPSIEMAYTLIQQNDWTGYTQLIPEVEELSRFTDRERLTRWILYCPKCLSEENYIRFYWQIKASNVCLKHQVWLQDRCSLCHSCLRDIDVLFDSCHKCHAKLSLSRTETASKLAIHMQSFLQNKNFFYSTTASDCLLKNHCLSFLERAKLINFFIKWHPERLINWRLGNKKSIRDNIQIAGETLFSGKNGFWQFLERMNKDRSGYHFIKFYRALYTKFSRESLSNFKYLLELYIQLHWQKSIDKRNSLFSEITIKEHLWLPVKRVCEEFDINRSDLRKAIKTCKIKSQQYQKEKRIFVVVYKPDVQKYIISLKNIATFKDITTKLGVTKKQLLQLVKSGHFSEKCFPEKNVNRIWTFSHQEVDSYLQSIFSKTSILDTDDCVPMSKAMKIVGNRVAYPFSAILNAIQKSELPVTLLSEPKKGIRALGVPFNELKKWIKKKTKSEYFSIPEVAKLLNINQEFTYQLVNAGLLTYTVKENQKKKQIKQKDIDDFNKKYILLANLARMNQINSRKLMNTLGKKGIYPVDHLWEVKLRQKIYNYMQLMEFNYKLLALKSTE